MSEDRYKINDQQGRVTTPNGNIVIKNKFILIRIAIVFINIFFISDEIFCSEYSLFRPIIIELNNSKSKYKIETNGQKNGVIKIDSNIFLIKEVNPNYKYFITKSDSNKIQIPFFDSSNNYISEIAFRYMNININSFENHKNCIVLKIIDWNILDFLGGQEFKEKTVEIYKSNDCSKKTIIEIYEDLSAKQYYIYKNIPRKLKKYFKQMHWTRKGKSYYSK